MTEDKKLYEMETKIDINDELRYYQTLTEDVSHEYTLIPFSIEGKLNQMHFEKGWRRRFIVREIDGVLHILLNNGYDSLQALFMIKEKKLYAISGIFEMHWALIRRIFKEEYNDIETIGRIPY